MNAPLGSGLTRQKGRERRRGLRMLGRIERCWLFTFRAPEEAVRRVVPAPLEPVALGGFGFWNVVACEIAEMRPWPLPAWLGLRYRHVAYRVHVRAPRFAYPGGGNTPEGLYFVRSDCDSGLIGWSGNAVTDFRFHVAPVDLPGRGERGMVRVGGEMGAEVEVDPGLRPELSWESPFGTVAEAAAYLKYRPAALSADGGGGVRAVRIRRIEEAWRARVVGVRYARWEFFEGMEGVAPEVCYEVEPIEYQWERTEGLVAAGAAGVECGCGSPRRQEFGCGVSISAGHTGGAIKRIE